MALGDNRVRGGSGGWEEEEGWDVLQLRRALQISSCRIRSESGKMRQCASDNCYRIQSTVVDLLTKKCFNTTSVEWDVNTHRRWIQMSS